MGRQCVFFFIIIIMSYICGWSSEIPTSELEKSTAMPHRVTFPTPKKLDFFSCSSFDCIMADHCVVRSKLCCKQFYLTRHTCRSADKINVTL